MSQIETPNKKHCPDCYYNVIALDEKQICPKCNITLVEKHTGYLVTIPPNVLGGFITQSHLNPTDLTKSNTYSETIGILADLTNEFILLETIRATAKELINLRSNIRTTKEFNDKLNELEHLVNTD